MDDVQREFQGKTPAGLQWSMWAGFLAWGADLGLSYVLQQHACSTGHYYVLRGITAVTLVVALSGFVAAFQQHRKLAQSAEEQGVRPSDRALFQARLGIGFSLGFVVVIIAAAVPRWILGLCA
jgi:uncharacterized membrane protein